MRTWSSLSKHVLDDRGETSNGSDGDGFRDRSFCEKDLLVNHHSLDEEENIWTGALDETQ